MQFIHPLAAGALVQPIDILRHQYHVPPAAQGGSHQYTFPVVLP